MFTSRWAVPAEKIPAGRLPGMCMAPRGRSRQPMHSTMAPAWISSMPLSRLVQVRTLSREMSSTMVFSWMGMFMSFTRRMKRQAYSGPVSSSLKVCRPKPLWMHWFRMPPGTLSRSRISMSSAPASRAPMAAASPAGPAPTMTTS